MQTATILSFVFGGLWLAALVAFIPYVARTRHPKSKPLGAYLSFVTVFSVVAYMIFGALVALDRSWLPKLPLDTWVGAIAVLVITFLPAFWAASWMISREPPRAPSLDGAPPNVEPVGSEPELTGHRR